MKLPFYSEFNFHFEPRFKIVFLKYSNSCGFTFQFHLQHLRTKLYSIYNSHAVCKGNGVILMRIVSENPTETQTFQFHTFFFSLTENFMLNVQVLRKKKFIRKPLTISIFQINHKLNEKFMKNKSILQTKESYTKT